MYKKGGITYIFYLQSDLKLLRYRVNPGIFREYYCKAIHTGIVLPWWAQVWDNKLYPGLAFTFEMFADCLIRSSILNLKGG